MQRCTPTSYRFIMSNALLTVIANVACAWLQKILGVVGTTYRAVKIAERMAVRHVHVYCTSHTPLALVVAESQTEAGCAHTCNPSLSSLESQTAGRTKQMRHKMNRIWLARSFFMFFTVRTGNRGGNFMNLNSSQLELEVYPSPATTYVIT